MSHFRSASDSGPHFVRVSHFEHKSFIKTFQFNSTEGLTQTTLGDNGYLGKKAEQLQTLYLPFPVLLPSLCSKQRETYLKRIAKLAPVQCATILRAETLFTPFMTYWNKRHMTLTVDACTVALNAIREQIAVCMSVL
jgi:hypothetical protein